MKQTTLIISDCHIGRDKGFVREAGHLKPLFEACDHLVINGDAVETHHPNWRDSGQAHLDALREIATQTHTRLTCLPGNHDPEINNQRHLEFADGQVVATHGDAFDLSVAPWSSSAASMRATAERVYMEQITAGKSERDATLEATRQAALTEWEIHKHDHGGYSKVDNLKYLMKHPKFYMRIIAYWRSLPELATTFTEAYFPDARFIIFGHAHRNLCITRGKLTIINTGCFDFPAKPWGVLLQGKQMSLHGIHFNKKSKTWQLSKKKKQSWEL